MSGRSSVHGVYAAVSNALETRQLYWWRRGESEYSALWKIRNLLIFRDAQNVENGKIAPNWNVSGTRDFQPACHISFSGNYVILLSDLAYCLPTSQKPFTDCSRRYIRNAAEERALRFHGKNLTRRYELGDVPAANRSRPALGRSPYGFGRFLPDARMTHRSHSSRAFVPFGSLSGTDHVQRGRQDALIGSRSRLRRIDLE